MRNNTSFDFTTHKMHSIDYGTDMYCGRDADLPSFSRTPGPAEYKMTVPHMLRQAQFHLETIRPGMLVTMCNVIPPKDMSISFRADDSPISLGAIISGRFAMQCRNDKGGKSLHVGEPGEIACRSVGVSGEMTIPGGKPFCMVSVSIDEEVLLNLLHSHRGYHSLIRMFDNNQCGFNVFGKWDLSPAIKILISQMFQCSLQGVSRDLYLESKTLEILALQLDKLTENKKQSFPLSKNDVERLHEARKILFDSMECPPSLTELASRVGINDFKLKKGFHELFGTTVYGALRKHRIDTAHSLLLDGNMTVTTAAVSVGYSNISHFINTFREYYNITPGKLLKQSRRSLCK